MKLIIIITLCLVTIVSSNSCVSYNIKTPKETILLFTRYYVELFKIEYIFTNGWCSPVIIGIESDIGVTYKINDCGTFFMYNNAKLHYKNQCGSSCVFEILDKCENDEWVTDYISLFNGQSSYNVNGVRTNIVKVGEIGLDHDKSFKDLIKLMNLNDQTLIDPKPCVNSFSKVQRSKINLSELGKLLIRSSENPYSPCTNETPESIILKDFTMQSKLNSCYQKTQRCKHKFPIIQNICESLKIVCDKKCDDIISHISTYCKKSSKQNRDKCNMIGTLADKCKS